MARLTDPVTLGGRTAPARVVFGAHETNLGRGRTIGDRHLAYYRERAAGGTGVLVTETASVHPSDWPYERAPLARSCAAGWADLAEACRPFSTVVLAGLGHCGAQGSSAHSQSALWAPSPVADAVSRELPLEMDPDQIEAVVAGFVEGARVAVDAGLDGVEVDAGATSLLRQFHSGITNLRTDGYGRDRLALTTEVLTALRDLLGADAVLGLRLSCDELAPWAGVTPDQAAEHVDRLAEIVDLLVVVRGGPYSASAYRPDAHTAPAFNLDLCARMNGVVADRAAVVLQGSVVEVTTAEAALETGACHLVEMTRAQIAEPRLVGLVRSGQAGRARPCILCNQACRVRDDRNPLVSCVGEPRSGYETVEAVTDGRDERPASVLVVGAGPAGLECARVLSGRGHRVRVAERTHEAGGALRGAAVGPGRRRLRGLTDWLVSECLSQGVTIDFGVTVTGADVALARAAGDVVVVATGSRPAQPAFATDGSCTLVDALALLERSERPEEPVLVFDPVGGPIGVGVAEWLVESGLSDVGVVTQDPVVGTQLSRTGDLADANTRLQRAGVERHLRSSIRRVEGGQAVLCDVWTGEQRRLPCVTIVDCGHRLPEDRLALSGTGTVRVGDCVAPRTVLEAVLEGRRAALAIAAGAGNTELGTVASEGLASAVGL